MKKKAAGVIIYIYIIMYKRFQGGLLNLKGQNAPTRLQSPKGCDHLPWLDRKQRQNMRRGHEPSRPDIAHDLDGLQGSPTEASNTHGFSTWSNLPSLAFEYAYAVRNAFPGDQLRGQDGFVQHESQAAVGHDAGSVTCVDPGSQGEVEREHSTSVQQRPSSELDESCVRAEAARVEAKFVYNVDTASEIVMRLDFMNNYDTRVSTSLVLRVTTACISFRAVGSPLSRLCYRLLCL